ncbi:unnamed protein product [Spirodela intermedia]|uniref:Protein DETOXIFICATION n=1 Tax=Spirodela intermedia TaxID=51605 RepID=A0A7I8J5D9_SPIIN|nr:unnamed protein product [Spirodela intermedia]CAA6665447.1 unnamed protein product [Spirodela intermedia]
MVAVSLSLFMLTVMSMMMVGHLGELALSGTAIATSFTSVTGISLLMGMASGLDTLCGQAFGAEQYQKLGTHTHTAIFTLFLVCLPVSLLWASVDRILCFLGQDPQISQEAGRYAAWMIPALFAFAVSQPLMRFLQAQSLILPMLMAAFFTLCLHAPLCWALVFKSCLGNAGAALAIGISMWVNALILGLYVYYSSSCKATRAPLTREAFWNVREFLRLALPSALMICLEWWSFELLILMSGLLPNPQLETSVLSICLSTISTLYAIPYGIGAAVSTRVSNELGAGNPAGAQASVFVAILVTATEGATVSLALFSMRRSWGYAYSNVEEVVHYAVKMAPLVCASIITDALQGLSQVGAATATKNFLHARNIRVARGCGWQHLGAAVNLASFYLFGIPVALVGLWTGILCGSTLQTVLLSLLTGFINWEHQANKARKRVFGGSGEVADF